MMNSADNITEPLHRPESSNITTLPSRLLLGWFVGSCILLVLMLNHTSDSTVLFGRYSLSYAAMLGVTLSITATAGLGYLLGRRGRLPVVKVHLPQTYTFAFLVIAGGLIALALVWLWLRPGGSHLPPIAIFRLYIAALIFAGILVLLRASGTFDLALPTRWIPRLVVLIVVVSGLLAVGYLGRVPASSHYDEPFIVYWGVSWFTSGEPRITMLPFLEREFVAMHPAGFLVFGAWLKTVGISLESGRFFWMIVGWLCVPFIYLTARRLYGRIAALFALAFAALVLLEHNYIRPDFIIALAVSVALYCYFRARDTNSIWLHFVTGFVLALSVEGHPYGARFAISFGLVYVLNYVRLVWTNKRWHWNRAFLMFAAGGFAYFVCYLVLHFIIWAQSDLMSGFDTLTSWYRLETGIGGSVARGNPLAKAVRYGLEWLVNYPIVHPIEAALALFGIVAAVRRREAADKLLILILLPSLLIFFLTLAHYNPYYWIHNLPFIAILGGAFLAQVCGAVAQSGKLNVASLATVSGIVVLLIANVQVISKYGQSADQLIDIGKEIGQLLPAQVQRVSGWQIYYYGLSDREFYDILSFSGKHTDDWLTDWGIEPPQAVIVTPGLDDTIPNLRTYLESGDISIAQCFETTLFDGQVILYMEKNLLPEGAPINCNEPQS